MSLSACCDQTGGPPRSISASTMCASNGAFCNIRSNVIVTNQLIVNGTSVTNSCRADPNTYTTFDAIPADPANPLTPGALLNSIVLASSVQFARISLGVQFDNAGASVTRLIQITLNGFAGGPIAGNPSLLFQITNNYPDGQSVMIHLDILRKDANTVSIIATVGDSGASPTSLLLLMNGNAVDLLVFDIYGGSDAPGSCSLVHTTETTCQN